jgi:hypothetical protein
VPAVLAASARLGLLRLTRPTIGESEEVT